MTIFLSTLVIILCFYTMFRVVENYFMKSLDSISDWLKLTPTVAGATLMAFGTSAPELSTALVTLFVPNTDPATGLGSIVGAALFQTLVVIGFAAIVHTTHLDWKPVLRDGLFYALAIFLLIIFAQDGVFTFIEAGFFVLVYISYLGVQLYWSKSVEEAIEPDALDIIEEGIKEMEKRRYSVVEKIQQFITKPIDSILVSVLKLIPDPDKKPKWTIPVFFISLIIIGLLSYFLVLASETLADSIGVPHSIVALTILAGGGALPEIIASVIVSKNNKGDMAVSNAIGSNIFDILISLGLPLLFYTMVNGNLGGIDDHNIHSSMLLLFATLISVVLLLIVQRFNINRWSGGVLIFLYILYVFAAYTGRI
ncbi:calcium/sodium antiporter [Candidatus Dojkabacteria bacterium]|nr:calcium/sodium antiporter [Candidatus Dojkabacteria bacterium]